MCSSDTNCLMQYSKKLFESNDEVHICGYVLRELEKHKQSNNEEKKFLSRRAVRDIEVNKDKVRFFISEGSYDLPSCFDKDIMDNKIISNFKEMYDKDNSMIFYSNDILFRHTCQSLGIPCEKFGDQNENEEETYRGYRTITMGDFELASFYESPVNRFNLLLNEYLLIKNKNGDIIDKQRWDGIKFSPLTWKKDKLDFTHTEKIKPRNIQQELAFDLFANRDIKVKVIFGKHGSGKDLIMATHGLSMVSQGIYDRLIFVRNNYEVKNSKPIGFLPGDERSKLLSYAMPLADHVGGVEGLNKLIDSGVIVLQHLGFTRGRDIKKSLIYCTEAENMTREHIQLLIGRLAEGSALWLNGDFKQIDDDLFERNSGLKQTINRLKGQELFGCVELNITERSKTAQLADLLD